VADLTEGQEEKEILAAGEEEDLEKEETILVKEEKEILAENEPQEASGEIEKIGDLTIKDLDQKGIIFNSFSK